MRLLDLAHQVKGRLPKRFGGTGNPYGWGAAVVEPYRNSSGATIALGTIVRHGAGASSICEPDPTEGSTDVLGVVVGYYTGGDASTLVEADAAANALAAVMTKGRCRVRTAVATVNGQYAYVSSTAGQAKSAATLAAGAFGVFETTGDPAGLTWVHLFGAPVLSVGTAISPLTTKGDIWGFDTSDARVPVGANGQYLKADSTDAQGVVWATLTGKWQVTATFTSVAAGDEIWVRVPYDCTVTGWDITANASGSAVVDVWMDTYANYPPTVADTIAGSELPTLSAARKGQDTSLSTWTTALVESRYLMFHVNSVSGIATLQVALYGTRTVA